MTYENAIKTASKHVKRHGVPVYIYSQDGGYQCAMMRWTELLREWQQNCVAVVMPDERVFTPISI